MSAELLPLLVAIPLGGAAISAIAKRNLGVQRVVGVVSVGAVFVLSVLAWLEADSGNPLEVDVGGWTGGVGIALAIDPMSGMILSIAMLLVLAVLLYAISQLGQDVLDWWFHPKYLALTAGVALSISTADLFNLFVGFELTLIASYTLLTVRSGGRQVRSTISYVVVNLMASMLFLLTVAFAYGTTGTLDLSDIVATLRSDNPAMLSVFSAMTLVVFGIKAALFPLYMWLPDSYPTAPAPVTAVFAGLLTKVGVYAIYRTQTLISEVDNALLLSIAAATMFFGILGALSQRDVKRILSFHIVSQIGYMLMGLGLFTLAGLAAGVAYIVNQIVVKTGLFLVAGEVDAEIGGSDIDAGSGLIKTRPWLAGAFAVLALSLAGVPPLGGFVVKFALINEGLVTGQWGVSAVALIVSVLTLFSMMKIWNGVFWGDRVGEGPGAKRGMRLVTGGVVVLSLLVALYASDLLEASLTAAESLLAAVGGGV